MFLGEPCQLRRVCASGPGPGACVGVGGFKTLPRPPLTHTTGCSTCTRLRACIPEGCSEWIKGWDTPGSVLPREPAVRSRIRDQRRLRSLLLLLCGVCRSKLALGQRHRSTIRLGSLEIIAATSGVSRGDVTDQRDEL